MKHSTPSFLAEAFRLVSTCPLCKGEMATDVHALRTEEDVCLAHVACGACHMALVVRLEPSDTGVACSAIVTDLSLSDARQAMRRSPMVHNDVLAIHEQINEGSFLASFAQRS